MTNGSSPTSQLVLRLFNLLDAIRQMSPFSTMSAEEEQLLGRLVMRWHAQTPFTVSDVMHEDASGSPSTVYRRIVRLREKGLADLRADPADKRIRYVEPTALSREYVQRLSDGLIGLFPDSPRQ